MSFRSCSLFLLLVLSACSVKEDRTCCPCTLGLFFTGFCVVDGSTGETAPQACLWQVSGRDGVVEGETVLRQMPRRVTLEVPRGEAQVTVWLVEDADSVTAEGMMIREGNACPPVYLFSAGVDCRGEEAGVEILFHKAFARLVCVLKNASVLGGGGWYEVCGGTCGYGLGGEPLAGPFRCPLAVRRTAAGSTLAAAVLPRQRDDGLRLEVYSADRSVLRSFAVGEYLAAAGYDWTAPDLEDIRLEIDLASTAVRLLAAPEVPEYSRTLVL